MNREPLSPEFESLLAACIEGDCDCRVWQDIKDAVEGDSAALIAYVDAMHTHAMLQWRYSARLDVRLLEESLRTAPLDRQSTNDNSNIDAAARAFTQPLTNENTLAFVPAFFSTTLHDVHGAAGYLSSGWPVAYLIATVIVGIGRGDWRRHTCLPLRRGYRQLSASGCRTSNRVSAEGGGRRQDHRHGLTANGPRAAFPG